MDVTSLAMVAIVLVLATTMMRTLSVIDRLVRLLEAPDHKARRRKKHRKK